MLGLSPQVGQTEAESSGPLRPAELQGGGIWPLPLLLLLMMHHLDVTWAPWPGPSGRVPHSSDESVEGPRAHAEPFHSLLSG